MGDGACDPIYKTNDTFSAGTGESYCILHAPLDSIHRYRIPGEGGFTEGQSMIKKEYNIGKFNSIVFDNINRHINQNSEQISMQGIIYLGDIDFTSYHNNCPLPEVKAEDSVFHGNVNFTGVRFDGFLNLSSAEFKRDVSFIRTVFEKGVSFKAVHFLMKANFKEIVAVKELLLDRAVFAEGTHFFKCTINASFRARGAKFHKVFQLTDSDFESDCKNEEGMICENEVNFSACEFMEGARFLNNIFESKVVFDIAKFKGMALFHGHGFMRGVSFGRAKFSDNVEFLKIKFKLAKNAIDEEQSNCCANFSECEFYGRLVIIGKIFGGEVNFKDVYMEENAKFNNCNVELMEFSGTSVDKINFINCEWAGNNDRLYDEECLSEDADSNEIKKVESLYRQLKERNTRDQDWPRVSNWHYREKEMTLRIERRWRTALKWFFLRVYKFLSGYNERPSQAISVLFLIVICLGLSIQLTNIFDAEGISGFFVYMGHKAMNGMEYLPFIETSESDSKEIYGSNRGWSMVFQTAITIQIALVVMSVRNKLRR